MRLVNWLAAIALALLASAPALAQEGTPITIGRSYTLASRVLGADRVINVWTPPGYAQGSRRYPVVYLLDGGVDQDFHHITGLAQLGTVNGATRDVIIVGIATQDRRRELASRPVSDARLAADYPTAGGNAAFRRFVAEEVKPWVTARYRTDGDDTLMGESLAGLFVVDVLLNQPDLFRRYIAVDLSLWWDKAALVRTAAARLATHDDRERWLWLATANPGTTRPEGLDELIAALRARARPSLHWTHHPMPAETHATIYHPAALAAFRALFATTGQD